MASRRRPRVAGRSTPTPSSGGSNTPRFESPYQPPPGHPDLAAQVVDLQHRRTQRWKTRNTLETPTTGHSHPFTITMAGEHYKVRNPRPEALHAFTEATGPHIKDTRLRNDMIQLFLANHLEPDGFERIIYRLMDPDDEVDRDDLGNLMRDIVTLATNRPTVPSFLSR